MTPALRADDRASQCARAADYMAAHPGCGLRELAEGADLGSASKVVSEMPRFGYCLRRAWRRVVWDDGMRTRRAIRYWLEGPPNAAQGDLFT